MRISRTVAYAVRALTQLSHIGSSEPIPCSRIAADGKMPERFLLQVLRSLVNHGLLRSTRGVEGGYVLTRPTSKISLLQVIEAVEGPIEQAPMDDFPAELRETLQATYARLDEAIRLELGQMFLSQLAPNPPPKLIPQNA